MRNSDSASKGIGFALASNFYPDFLLWLVDDASGKQWLTFVDPKGLRNVDLSHPKLKLYKEVKELEATLAEQATSDSPALILNSFVLSSTKYDDIPNAGALVEKEKLEDRHVLFMEDGGSSYLSKMFSRIGSH